MNWLQKVRDILGKFWTVVFSEHNFTLGVENLEAVLSAHQQMLHDKWVMGNVMANKTMFRDRVPFVIYLLKAELVTDDNGTVMQSRVVHPASWGSANGGWLDSPETGDTDLVATVADGGWAVRSRFSITVPHHMSDHVVDYTRTLFKGADYDWQDNAFLFYFDPSELHLPEEGIMGDDGVLRIYWKIFGWADAELALKDAVGAFYDESLNEWADIVWDIHQNGATEYNTKQLLAGVTGAVVAEADGAVSRIWAEQDMSCMMVDDLIYHALAGTQINFSEGDNVKRGDILYGSLRFITGDMVDENTPSASDVPAMAVMTDAGRVVAKNEVSKDGKLYTDTALTELYMYIRNVKEYITIDGASYLYSYDPTLYVYKWILNNDHIKYTKYRRPCSDEISFDPQYNKAYDNPELTGAPSTITAYKFVWNTMYTQGESYATYTEWIPRMPDEPRLYTRYKYPAMFYMLPLTVPMMAYNVSDGIAADYFDVQQYRHDKSEYADVNVPDNVNPLKFILGNLRKARSALIMITVDNVNRALPAALDCIRRSVDASSIISVYLSAESDSVSAPASFTAVAGNAAVAVDATLTVQNMFAEAEIRL